MAVFNVAEAIDIGIEKEKKRRDFYALVAEKFSEKEMKDLFTRLRDWEEVHIAKFTEIRESVDQFETAESYPGEIEAYMKVFVDDKLYRETSPATFRREVETALDAIRRGISFEKDAILFFNELLAYVKPPGKDAIRKMIDEEKQHIVYLSQLKSMFE